jgi:hypothetical protein
MRRKWIVILQSIVGCAVWLCGVVTLQPAAPAQVTPPVEVEKAPKPKRPKVEATPPNPAPAAVNPKRAAPAPVKNASSAEIDSARSAGKVWVNTDSGVYHKSGKWYGATKQGKFMTEQDAVKSGYKAAKNEK